MKIFNFIRQKGYLMVGYSLLKAFGTTNALVFERLMTEYNYAINHKFINDKQFFAVSVSKISYHTGISENDVFEALNVLANLELIYVVQDEKYCFVRINEDEIIDFEKTAEIENNYKNWDYGIYSTQSIITEL